MESSNGLITCKSKRLSFTSKGVITITNILLLLVIVVSIYLVVKNNLEVPLAMKIIGPILLTVFFAAVLFTTFGGMLITKTGKIIFIPDCRIKITKIDELQRLALNFNQWKNNKYSVVVKFVYKDGRFFKKDYSDQFKALVHPKLSMTISTISKRKVDKIC